MQQTAPASFSVNGSFAGGIAGGRGGQAVSIGCLVITACLVALYFGTRKEQGIR